MMEFDEIVEKRQSIRSFKKKTVSWKDIVTACDAACFGPFADNRNTLKFLIIEEEKTISKIAEFSNQEWISECPCIIVVCSDDTNLENMHGERGRVYSRQQAGAAIQTILFKLVDLGLSSCWVGSFSDESCKQYLKIPAHIQIEAILPVGYEKGKTQKKNKKELENSLYWEEWGRDKRPTFIEESADEYGFEP